MTRSVNKMPLANFQAGSTAVARLPLGATYNTIMIEMEDGVGAITEANWGSNIEEIRLMVDGNAKIQIDAADLVSINKYYGHSHDDGVFPIFLTRHWMRTILGEDATGYNTGAGMASFTLEIDLKSGITINKLEVYAEQSSGKFANGQPIPFGAHIRIQKVTHTQSVAGEAEISDIPTGVYSMFAHHIKASAISKVEIEHDGNVFHNSSKAIREQISRIGGRTPQATFTHIDFAPDRRIRSALPMAVQDHRIKATFTAGPGAVPVYMESVQGRNLSDL